MKSKKISSLGALEKICILLDDESVWEQVIPVLRCFCEISGASAALFFLDGQLFELFHSVEVDEFELEAHGKEMARAAEKTGQDLAYPDLSVTTRGRGALAQSVQQMGLKGCVALPLKCQTGETVSMVLYFAHPMAVKLEALEKLRLARGILNLALGRESPPESILEELDEPKEEIERLATLGMQLEEKVDSFRAPATAIVEELEELELFLVELDDEQALEQRPPEYQVTRARITQAVSDMRQSAHYIQGGIIDLDASEPLDKKKEPIFLSVLGQEALVIATPELEKSGMLLTLTITADSKVLGVHRELLQLILGLILQIRGLITGHEGAIPIRPPALCIELNRSDSFAQLKISGVDLTGFVPNQSSLRIASAYGGEVKSQSPGLLVELPLMANDAWCPPSDLKILVIDDDPALGRALRRGLAPHHVKICASAAEGEIALLSGEFQPDSIICDLWLPGCNGLEFYQRLLGRDSQLASSFVLISGSQPDHETETLMKGLACPFLKKPLNIDQLKTLVMDHALFARKSVHKFS